MSQLVFYGEDGEEDYVEVIEENDDETDDNSENEEEEAETDELGGPCADCKGKYFTRLRDHFNCCHRGRKGDCDLCHKKPGFQKLTFHIKQNHAQQFGLFREKSVNHQYQANQLTGAQLKNKMIKEWGTIFPDGSNVAIKSNWLAVKDLEGNLASKFVAYRINASKITKQKIKSRSQLMFQNDESVQWPQLNAPAISDCDLERGHMMPARNCNKQQTSLEEGFAYTNVSPQYSTFNDGVLSGFETYERNVAKVNDIVYCVTGHVYDDNSEMRKVPGSINLKLCSYLFKILVIENLNEKTVFQAFLMRHVQFTEHWMFARTTVEEIETKAGVKLFKDGPKIYSWDAKITKHFCVKCQLYVPITSYYEHGKIHKRQNSCASEHCRAKFDSLEELRNHYINKHKLLICDIEQCAFGTKKFEVLEKHKQRHQVPKTQLCVTCGQRYTSDKGLRHHTESQHEDGKNQLCPVPNCCGKFYVVRDLHKHLFTHVDFSPFYCDLNECKDSPKNGFCSKASLKRHYGKSHKMSWDAAEDKVKGLKLDEPLAKLWKSAPFSELCL